MRISDISVIRSYQRCISSQQRDKIIAKMPSTDKQANLVVELNSAGYTEPVSELYPSDEIL